jgi:hypothetical protein
MRKVRTEEEKVARQIAKLISDVSLDLDEIGKHLATANPHLSYRRLLEIAEAAEYEKEAKYDREHINPLF